MTPPQSTLQLASNTLTTTGQAAAKPNATPAVPAISPTAPYSMA